MSHREARTMVEALQRLRHEAPPDLAPGVLAELGMVDAWSEVEGPIGPLFVAWSPMGITAVARAGDPDDFEAEYAGRVGRAALRVARPPARLAAQVRRRLQGERTTGPPVDLGTLSGFEQAVLRKTMEIPYGEVRPYAWVAREIGRPRAVRAVGSALAGNPVPFVIPCHRVVRADGRIGEYGAGGPEAKRAVLSAEGADAADLERLAGRGVRYLGSDSTHIYCFPTCRHARRTTARHLVAFRTAEDAVEAGYRPCRVCRPLESAPFAA